MTPAHEFLLRRWRFIRRGTDTLLAAIPEDKLEWSPNIKMRSFGDVIRHMIWSEAQFVGATVTGAYAAPSFPSLQRDCATLAGLRERWAQIHQQCLDGLQRMAAADFERPIPSPYDATRALPAVLVLSFHVEHELHHRSQLIQYISFLGLPAPSIFI
jgi:uncharacterized damage-inducible protein DinB